MNSITYNIPSNKVLGNFLKSIFFGAKPQYGLSVINENIEYIEAVKNVVMELENIDRLFNNTSEPDLIEYAIYEQYAVKLKFSYLIRKVKEKKIRSDDYMFL